MNNQAFIEAVWVKIRMEIGPKIGRSGRRIPATKQQVRALVLAVFESIEEAASRDQAVQIPHFGTFTRKSFPRGSEIYSPQLKKKVPRREDRLHTVRFHPSSVLVKRLNVSNDPEA